MDHLSPLIFKCIYLNIIYIYEMIIMYVVKSEDHVFAHINITASCKYHRFVLLSVFYKDSPNISFCVFIQHYIGDEIKEG